MIRTEGKFKGYIITNKINNKQYVGITSISVKHRWRGHKNDAKRNKTGRTFHLHKALLKYGIENFTIEEIKSAGSWEDICNWEIETIILLKTKTPNGYNLSDGGSGPIGLLRTQEDKDKISNAKVEYYKDPEKRKEQGIRSKQRWDDPEYKKRCLKSNKEIWDDPDMRERHKKAVTEKCNTPEYIENKKRIRKELEKDPEYKKNQSKGQKERWANPKEKEKQSNTIKETWDNDTSGRKETFSNTMRKMINTNLQNPEYIKWRKENPPNGKPILYNNKYFRSTQEASRYFKLERHKITKDITLKKEGCKTLNPIETYNFEIKYGYNSTS